MKIELGKRKVYLLALIVLLVAVALLCVWLIWLKDDNNEAVMPIAMLTPTSTPETGGFLFATPEATADADIAPAGSNVSAVVYYQDNNGYLVPVMRSLPLEDGIAKATISLMVKSGKNDMEAARLGLRTVIPENTSIDLDISGGKARIDLSKEAMSHIDAASENNMVQAIIQTLTEFDTVKTVEFLFGGQKVQTLAHGTDVSGVYERGDINIESSIAPTSATGKTDKVTLYFPGESSSVVVPVTRVVSAKADINTAVIEIVKGPKSDALENCVPEGCGLIDVTVEGGVAKLNFTKEFMQIVNNIDGGRIALKALIVTCAQFEGVNAVEIYVEGEKFDIGIGDMTAPSFSNIEGEIAYDYIQTQSSAIFNYE